MTQSSQTQITIMNKSDTPLPLKCNYFFDFILIFEWEYEPFLPNVSPPSDLFIPHLFIPFIYSTTNYSFDMEFIEERFDQTQN